MKHHDLERRRFLGRVLALGGTAVMPAALLARETRNVTGPEHIEEEDKPVKDPPPVPAGNKLTKAEAQYQDQPNGTQQCAGCAHFQADSNTCTLVEGDIAPEGWCRLWVTNG